MPTTFMWSAPLGSFGNPNQPMFDHLGKMHRLFVKYEATLAGQAVPPRQWISSTDPARGYRRVYAAVGASPGLTFVVSQAAHRHGRGGSVAMLSPSGAVLFNSSADATGTIEESGVRASTHGQSPAPAATTLTDWAWWPEPPLGHQAAPDSPAGPAIVSAPAPLEQLALTEDKSDYLTYSANFTVATAAAVEKGGGGSSRVVCTLSMLVSDATIVYSWLDGTFTQAAGVLDNSLHNSPFKTFALELPTALLQGTHQVLTALILLCRCRFARSKNDQPLIFKSSKT